MNPSILSDSTLSDSTQSDSTVSNSPASDSNVTSSPASNSAASDSAVAPGAASNGAASATPAAAPAAGARAASDSPSPSPAGDGAASPAPATSGPATSGPAGSNPAATTPASATPATAATAATTPASPAAAGATAEATSAASESPASASPVSAPPAPEPIKAKVVVVTSGKGGVGKTTTSASFAAGLALRGLKTAVIDFDIGLRNLDLIMGCERRVVYDLINVIQGEATLNQALVRDKQCENLFVLAASQTRDKEALTLDGVERILRELGQMGFDYIVCDSPAGIETGALTAMHFADDALIVTNPEVSSVRDSDRILGMLGSKTRRAIDGREPIKEHLLITRYNPARVKEGQMLSLDDIQDILRIKLIGIIPESETVLQASNQGMPSIHMQGSDVAEAYGDVIRRFLGEERPMRFIEAQKPGFFRRMFGGR